MAKTPNLRRDILLYFLDLSTVAPSRPSGLFMCLFTADPTQGPDPLTRYDDGYAGDEVVAGVSYARQALTLDLVTTVLPFARNFSVNNPGAILFGPATGAGFGTVTHAAIARGGVRGVNDLLIVGPLSTPRTINAGDTLNLPVASIVYGETS